MNSKWYISTLFLIIAYFGVFHEQVSVPNQEIVLEFVDTQINKTDVKSTIADVKERLLKVGVSNIKIQETKNGALKISYYSLVDIDNIKDVLFEENKLVSNKSSKNKEEKNTSSNYSIDIYELTNETDSLNLNDKFVFEIKNSSDRFTSNNTYASLKNLEDYKANQLYKTAFKISKKDPFSKDHTSYKEPEVRAGPYNLNL